MEKLFGILSEALDRGEDAVLVTIVASSGSAPRGAGARMLVTRTGRLYGTIGGGAVEYKSEAIAAEILNGGSSRQESFRLYRNEVEDLGMVCGGAVDVYFRRIAGDDGAVKALLAAAKPLFARREAAWLITELTEGSGGTLSVYSARTGLLGAPVPQEVLDCLGPRPKQCRVGDRVFYCEKLLQPGRVYLFGGGHIAHALVPILTAADFSCVVLDDRPEFADPARFPGAETRCIDPSDISDLTVGLTPEDCVCIMTRGHRDDMVIQRQVMASRAGYIGVIGSARKQQTVKEQLLASGCTEADFAAVASPMGLNIGAESPAEIAVSIAAQLIRVRAGMGPGEKDWKGALSK